MSSLTNINNNAAVVNVGRTTPVTPGAQPAAKSIPVVVATDQTAIPVVEQNKIQSEVALSLLGIPRSEVALGIFADVNTYDVNPSEWSSEPAEYSALPNTFNWYTGIGGLQGWGIRHLPEESGALVTAPADETSVLTSKRFFRYQPGRVSAATFGIKSSSFVGDVKSTVSQRDAVLNPPNRKYGIFDKFDGYYWETRDTSQGDQFAVVRRTQSILRYNPLQFGTAAGEQLEDHALAGKPPASSTSGTNKYVTADQYNAYPTATNYLSQNRKSLIEQSVLSNEQVKCRRDLGLFLESVAYDMSLATNYNATFQALAEANSFEYLNDVGGEGANTLPTDITTAIDDLETDLKALSGVSGNADTAVDNYFNRFNAIVRDPGTKVSYDSATQTEQINFLKGVTFETGVGNTLSTAGQKAAALAIQANYDYIAEEVNKYVENYYPAATHNAFKCTRDVLFAVNAVCYDVLYGGTQATYDAARFFSYDGFPKSDQSGGNFLTQTVEAYKHLRGFIDDVVLGQAYDPQTRCSRDLGYILDGIGFDITLGTNYNATFLGLAESNSTEYPEDSAVSVTGGDGTPWGRVVGALTDTQTQVKALAGVDATADTAVDNFYDRLFEIAVDQNTRVEYYSTTQQKQINFLKGITFTNPTSGRTASQIAVKDKIQANYDFLTAEINAWVNVNYPNSEHPVAKCTRDVLFVANAVAYDMLYGGNKASVDATQFFFYEDFAQTTDVHKNQTVAAYERLVEILPDILQGVAITKSTGNSETQVTSGTNVDLADANDAADLVQIFVDAITAGSDNTPTEIDPSVAWAIASYTNAKSAIDTDAATISSSASATAYSGYQFPVATQNTANVATTAEARRVTDLIDVFVKVIKEGDIIDKSTGKDLLPENRLLPDYTWQATADLVTGSNAIINNKDSVLDGIVSITFSGDDIKCIRDMDFALDAYINDLKWGGNGHIIANGCTYTTGLIVDAEREGETHYYFRNVIRDALQAIGETDAKEKIGVLAGYQIQAVTANGTGDKYPAQPGPDGVTGPISSAQITAATYGQRPKLDTIFSVYDKYLGYLVSQSLSYDTSTFDEDVLKYKCARDVRYVVEAYASDLQYGGNAATAYQAYKYYEGDTLKVFSQATGGTVAEIARHTFLKDLLTSSSNVTVTRTDASTVNIPSVADKFNLSTAQRDKLADLADLVIGNFTTKYAGSITYGDAGQFGDLVILRDGLIMTHGAVYDPSLLRPQTKYKSHIDIANDTIEIIGSSCTIGQYVVYYGDCPELVDGKMYFVSNVQGPKSNVIQLVDPDVSDFDEFDFQVPESRTPIVLNSVGTQNFVQTVVPFKFPNTYTDAAHPSDWPVDARKVQDGMFPYMYSSSGVLPLETVDKSVGFIDTAVDTSVDAATLRSQIDALNYKYKTWVRDMVDPTYYSVYEYRVPRSRFSGDSLDGLTRGAVYSDNVLDNKAGAPYTENNLQVQQTSVWDMDFSKVTMLKVEFSWYGAVGALFLAYVPVDNGEARWVRVHHLRASNQLKISSLGNATLPITYLVYGGGSENRFGLPNADRLQDPYGSYSESVVKYGASYYIDGGDRGTVRLFNHSSDTPTPVYGSKFKLGVTSTSADDPVAPYFTVSNLDPDTTGRDAPAVSTYYVGAKVITGNSQDQNVEVIWIDGNDIYLNKPVSQVSTIDVIADRPAIVYGLKTKDNILSGEGIDVRNRVQVYPTRLSVGSAGSENCKVTLLKSPIFQTPTITTGSIQISTEVDINETYGISVDNTSYLNQNGDFTYGWFQASLNGSETLISVLGRLEKADDEYYFYPTEDFSGTLVIAANSPFLKEGVFDSQGNSLTSAETTFEKERLSSVEVALRAQAPIPRSGTGLASYYIAPGAEDFDLLTYFDYNKEYISYPLTDKIETLYLATFANATNSASSIIDVSASLTWEEQ